VHASSSYFNVNKTKADVIDLSSSDTEEALDLLYLCPAHGPHYPLSNFHSSFDSDLFEEWLEANDVPLSVYVVLTAYASISRASTVDSLCGG
jgi:hypothetical protein